MISSASVPNDSVPYYLLEAFDKWKTLIMPFQVPDYFEESILTVFTSSEYVFQHCEQNPNLLIALLTRGDLFVAYHEQTYHEKLAQLSFDNEAALMKTLRLFRHQEMVRIAWRDIANWENLSQILRELSWLA